MNNSSRGRGGILVILIAAAIIGYLAYSGKIDTGYLKILQKAPDSLKDAAAVRDIANQHERENKKALQEIN